MSKRCRLYHLIQGSFFLLGLFLFFAPVLRAEPLDPVYILPKNALEFKADLFTVEKRDFSVCGQYKAGMALTDLLSFYYSLDYIHYNQESSALSGPGDSHAAIRRALNIPSEKITAVLSAEMTIPTGGDLYANDELAGLSFGNYELLFSGAVRWNLSSLYITGSAGYVSRQGKGENYFSRDFFLPARAKNDYLVCALSCLVPVNSRVELYASLSSALRVWKKTEKEDYLPVAGCGLIPLPLSLGTRRFFSPEAFISIYGTEQLRTQSGSEKRSFGTSVSLLF
ncbi:MAG: hypothetical protein ACRCUT_05685 [Spirochaetota bacterium]